MTQFTRGVAVAGAVALALGMGVAGSTVAAAGPTTPGSAPTYAPTWLALTTGTTNTVQLVDSRSTGARPTQTLTSFKACSFKTSGTSLLAFSSEPESPGVGLANGALGVRESQTSSGTSCSAVDTEKGESLSMRLDSVGGLVAASASLDIDLKQSSQILATATDPDGDLHYFMLLSGSSIDNPIVDWQQYLPDSEQTAELAEPPFKCSGSADSGPDSKTANNCRWDISAPSWTDATEDGIVFTSLTLKPLVGSFSLMGGADGYVDGQFDPLPGYFGPSGPSVFELVEGVVDCSEGTNTVTLRGDIPSSWKRLVNLGGTEDSCQAYPYGTRTGVDANGRQFAEMTKPLDFETKAQALWTTTFFVGGGNTVPPITMELDRLNNTPLIIPELFACPDTYYTNPAAFVPPSYPYACLVSAVRGTGKQNKYASYTAFVYGDAGMRR